MRRPATGATAAFTLEPTVLNGPLIHFNGQKVPDP